MTKPKKRAAGSKSKKRASNPPKRKFARKRAASKTKTAGRKRRYTRKRNPPGSGAGPIIGAVLGGLGAALAGNLIAAAAGGSEAMRRAIRIAVPAAVAMIAGRRTGAMAQGVESGAFGAAGVEFLDVIMNLRKGNPPIQILRKPNPGAPRFANPQGGMTAYPATVHGQLPPPYISPLRFVPGKNPYSSV